MEAYVRFNNTPSPFASRAGSLDHGMHDGGSDSDEGRPMLSRVNSSSDELRTPWHSAWASVSRLFQPRPKPAAYQSGYLTLIPLSDSRLKPRRTKLIVGLLLLLAAAAVTGVFFAVPRGLTTGEIDVHTTKMTFNATTLTYRIILLANVPVFNPNYVKAKLTGNLTVSFYDAEAGSASIGPIFLDRRSNPQLLGVKVDASNLPRKYTQVVYTACFNFPRQLIFFLRGQFQAEYLGSHYVLPNYDTYFMLDCSDASKKAGSKGSMEAVVSKYSSGGGMVDLQPHNSRSRRRALAEVRSGNG